jgi:ERCC4-related helicase
MSLREVPPKEHYISGVDDLVRDFYIPTLQKSTVYQRRTGYFNSRALAMASRGLSGLLRNGGHMQLICSVELDEDEREVYESAAEQRKVIKKKAEEVARMLERPYDELERDRLALLAELLSQGLLEIKIAYRPYGIYHEKVGIMKDADGNAIVFSGSDNETPGGWENNTESFHAFSSWEYPKHVRPEVETFDALWDNRLQGTTVVPLPEAVKQKILRYKLPDGWRGEEKSDPVPKALKRKRAWKWTPELAYIAEAPRLWNHANFAYGDVGVTPFEHQDYVAASVLKQWPPRCMLADEVGLGKTIEAGLILYGFEQAGRLDRVLILAPKNILKQWQLQLLSKFNITAWMLDGDHVYGPQPDPNVPAERVRVDRSNPFATKPIMLVSSQLINRDERLEQLLQLEYDLVFLDEAHHARARGPSGKRAPNKLLLAMERLKLHTQGLVFMTATPIQLDRRELWDLLMVLELPGQWQNEDDFDRFYTEINEPRPDWAFLFEMVRSGLNTWEIDQASVEQLQSGYPDVDVGALMQRIIDDHHQGINGLDVQEREALKVLLFRHAPSYRMIYRNTRELLKRYHEEGKFKERIADREPQPPDHIDLAGSEDDPRTEAGLYTKIDEYVSEYYAKYNDVRKGLGFIMEVYRKRLTSSFEAIRLSLERRRDTVSRALATGDYGPLFGQMQQESEEVEEELLSEENADDVEIGEFKESTKEMDQMRRVLRTELQFLDTFVDHLGDIHTDSKFEYLERMLRDKFNSGVRRVIIFSQFKDTVNFILERLQPIYGEKLGSYTGDGGSYYKNNEWVRCSKQKIQEKFRTDDDSLSILVCTDAASEGLDLQSCNTLINYDLPWNPMRIEQRIGRVDRIGQQSHKVYVHSLYYRDTVEEDVYRVCLERLELFRSTLGNMQPVLIAGNVESIIRKGAMARTKEERAKVLSEASDELDKSIAQIDENIRIFAFLNSYEPQLQLDRKEAPISQAEMETVLAPYLEEGGWSKEEDRWTRGTESITFDPKVLDQKDENARLITPSSDWTAIFDGLGDVPEIVRDDRSELYRFDIDGTTGFIVRHGADWFIVSRLRDIRTSEGRTPEGMPFGTREEAERYLRSIVREHRLETLEAQDKAWRNRLDGWKARTHMYLDEVLRYVWKAYGNALDYDEEALNRVWSEYLGGLDRKLTRQLSMAIAFEPTWDAVRSRRGRLGSSPRNTSKEEILLAERERIVKNIKKINDKRKSMA